MYCTEVMSGEDEENNDKIVTTDFTKTLFGSGQDIFHEVEGIVLECLRSEGNDTERSKKTIEKVCPYVPFNSNRIISSNLLLDYGNLRPIIERRCLGWF